MANEAKEWIPPSWTYNPSTWPPRLPIVGLALVGFGIAGYLTAYQLGFIATVWEPIFGRGSEIILTSWVSHVLPVPDAALGAAGYLLDAITGVVGGRGRWRAMPWIVILFGLAVGPLGAVSILLAIAQPVLFDAWCTLCLASAVVSLAMIGPAMDVLLASSNTSSARRPGGSRGGASSGASPVRTSITSSRREGRPRPRPAQRGGDAR
jgi:uncharacterized membrane protein